MQKSDPSELPQVLTVAEVATYLRVSQTTIWRWCGSGKLPAFRLGRSWRVRRTDLERLIANAPVSGDEADLIIDQLQ